MVKVDWDMNVERGLQALEEWLDAPVYKVSVVPETLVGKVFEIERGKQEQVDELTVCPPLLVPHFRQLQFNREKTGRLLFYFAKTMSQLEEGDRPDWIEAGERALEDLSFLHGKRDKRVPPQITALKKTWPIHMAEFFLHQALLLDFYCLAMDQIVEGLKDRQKEEEDAQKWSEEVWKHSAFVEYIVRDRWGAWDTNDINDDRWEEAKKLNPLHPKNQDALGE